MRNITLKIGLATTLIIGTQSIASSTGVQLLEQNRCMTCHNIMGKKVAPAFMGTAKKNTKWYGDKAQEMMIKSIKNGSKGKYKKFADTQMPAYPHISDEDLKTITSWILEEYSKKRALKNQSKM
ncbi:MAG TPA: cytochrome c [Arcobacter sp.]|nr:cytochrome c [Arcobacter sp.]HIP55826.1 cytochrome c [Arcobacter sp.]